MKKSTLWILSGILFLSQLVNSQIVNIPDVNFKNALLTGPNSGIDTNNDGQIQVSEAIAYTSPIDVTSKNISNLTGIETFSNIPILACGGNNLTTLNLTQNINLERLFCMNNQLKKLVLSNNSKLTLLYAYNNNLNTLNIANGNNNNMSTFYVANNPDLKCIKIDNGFTPPSSWVKDAVASYSIYPCPLTATPIKYLYTPMLTVLDGFQKITSATNVNIPDANFKNALLNNNPVIDINNDSEIQVSEANAYGPYLNVANKNISNLTGIEAFINLTTLACDGNNLTTLNVSQNINLEFLFCAYNPIKKLSLKYNTKLENLSSWNCNNLETIDIANGNNNIITNFNVINNPKLKCIKIDNGFTPSNTIWSKDTTARYSFYTCPLTAAIPDKTILSNMELLGHYKVNVYPNPTQYYLNITSNQKSEIKVVEIYTTGGNKILETTLNKVNVSKLQKGVYHLKITDSNNQTTFKKFIKN
ncbi:T9SS type A sorting domain-containing protein [Tenacibaculum aestuariivivum]|uniref:T9SS type A sorting domain-containing protein n=1 Tax=Tenacibaculum aestuariivivum TaxID=2006131 RepID=UPI003AB58875